MVRIKLRPSVEKDLERLDRTLRRKLIIACRDIFDDWTIGKLLGNSLRGLRSHRMDDYRIIYHVYGSSEIDIVAIGHRKDIYERLK
jgi:mRNA-degrading endonuclease RelE of RelBE toxin-antitoxin system